MQTVSDLLRLVKETGITSITLEGVRISFETVGPSVSKHSETRVSKEASGWEPAVRKSRPATTRAQKKYQAEVMNQYPAEESEYVLGECEKCHAPKVQGTYGAYCWDCWVQKCD
jgi:hypothetical protein